MTLHKYSSTSKSIAIHSVTILSFYITTHIYNLWALLLGYHPLFTPTYSDPVGHFERNISYPGSSQLGRRRRRTERLGVTDWMLRSDLLKEAELIINPKLIFSQHSHPFSSSSFQVSLPHISPHVPGTSFRCAVTLPGNNLFLIRFSSLLWYKGVDDTIWPTHNPVWWLLCVWVDIHSTFFSSRDQKLKETITVLPTLSWDESPWCNEAEKDQMQNTVVKTSHPTWSNVNVLTSLSDIHSAK